LKFSALVRAMFEARRHSRAFVFFVFFVVKPYG
jgi:hypothetical protein